MRPEFEPMSMRLEPSSWTVLLDERMPLTV